MKILISLSSYGKTVEQKVEELNELITEVVDSAVYPNVGMSEFFLKITAFLYAPNKAGALDDAIFAAQNAIDGNANERRRYTYSAKRTYEQDLSYAAFVKLKSECKKIKPITPKDAKKLLALFDRLASLNSAAQSLLIHSFDPTATLGHHRDLREVLENEGIFYEREDK